jgi:hypothetical protein
MNREFQTIEIHSELELPYKIMEINYRGVRFSFEFIGFDEGQNLFKWVE